MARVIGARAHANRLRKLQGPAMIREVNKALFEAGELIEDEAKRSIMEGAVSGKGHVASQPGEPPKNDSQVLHNNIETNSTGPLRVEVSSNAPYAVELEYGTSKMAARPYMAPAVQKKRREVVQLVRRAVSSAIKGA